jgi:phospholipase C
MHAATSAGNTLNDWSLIFDNRTIFNNLQDAGLTWAVYSSDTNEVLEFSQVNAQKANFKDYTQSFAADVSSGALPNYTYIIPRFLNTKEPANSQHPPHDARYGDNLIADVYQMLRANSTIWQSCAFIVIYDEHGGFYDHVVPPSQNVPNPDGINSPPPGSTASWAPTFAFDRLGLRVPAVIASPWIAQGKVDSTQYQHTSILATLKALFGLPSFLTKRDASANSFEALFADLSVLRADTPTTLPRATIPPVSASPTDPAHPANQPMDATQTEMLVGVHQMMRAADPDIHEGADLHMSQGQASAYIKACYEQLGKKARARGHFRIDRSGDKFHWSLCDAKGHVLARSAVPYSSRRAAVAAIKHARAASDGDLIE